MRKTYVQHPITGAFVLKEHCKPEAKTVIHGDIDSFVSPIDGSVIDDRGKLRRHNERYGVTDKRDYSDEYILKRAHQRHKIMTGQTKEAKQERIDTLKQAIAQHRNRYE